MNINFKETHETLPTRWFELYVGSVPTNIFYPQAGVIDFLTSDPVTKYGIDIDVESIKDLADQLIKDFDVHGPVFGDVFSRRTHLEISMALAEIRPRLMQKLKNYKRVV